MKVTAWVVSAALWAGAPVATAAQAPAHAQGAEAPAKARAHDEKRFAGLASKLGTTPQALADAFEAARQQDPLLKHKDFMAANVLAHNLGAHSPKVTAPALLAGLKAGKSLRQTLVSLGLNADDAKAAEKAAKAEVEEVDPKAADKTER